ncbi:MAG: glycosyltransferase [Desulfobacteraceae bacterium]|nr:glycosyltransferase [Desulfobacteraceae bacterium]
MSKPRISVIIPTLNSSKKIDKCLQAVFSQSMGPHEVIIVDAHSRDSTIEKANKFPVKIFLQDYGACGAARQIGLENATGEYVAFTDSDCIPSRDWLKNLVSGFDEHIVGVGGGIKNIGDTFWTRSINLAQNTFIGGGGSIQTRFFIDKRFVKSISASNMMFRKKDLVDIGGFNIHLSGADEAELNQRLVKKKKGKLLYVPDATILHDHGRNLKQFARNMYNYGRWRRECGVWDLPIIPPLIAPLVLLTLLINKWILPALIALYVAIIVTSCLKLAVQEKGISLTASIPIVYIIEHFCYVIGFWHEILRPRKMHRIT